MSRPGKDGAPSVLVAGGVNLDVLVPRWRTPRHHQKVRIEGSTFRLGGSAANTAVHLARNEITVSLVSSVGDDAIGDFCIESLARAGVDTRLVQRHPPSTGMSLSIGSPQSKRIVTLSGSWADHAISALDEVDLRAFEHVHLASYPSRTLLRFTQLARAARASISADWNGHNLVELAPNLDISFLNASELATVRSRPARTINRTRRLARQLAHTVVVTDSARRTISATPEGTIASEAVDLARNPDRVGAGDAFDAGYLAAYLDGGTPRECLRRGNAEARSRVLHGPPSLREAR